jgi:hypothetical protein
MMAGEHTPHARHSLADLVARDGPMDPRRAAMLAIELCGLLAAGRGRVRQAIDPESLGIEAGRLHWLDSGPARAASTGKTFESDGHAVARILVFLLTGGHPDGAARRIRDVRADLWPALAQIVDRRIGAPDRRVSHDLAALASELAMACGLNGGDATPGHAGPHEAADTEAPVRTRLGKPAFAGLGLLVLVLGALAAAGRIVAMPGHDTEAPPDGFSRQGALVLRGLEEQGDALVRRDDFVGATQAYSRIAQLAHHELRNESLIEGWHEVKLAWVRHLSWDYAGSAQHARVALGMIERTAPVNHPYRSVALAMMGLSEAQGGGFERAGALLGDALRTRAAALGLAAPSATVLTRLSAALSGVQTDWEWDEDWLLDIFEMGLGTNRKAPDSDADGVPDVDEDADEDGVPDGILYGLGFDPSRVIAHGGEIDPQREGFWRFGRLAAGPVEGPSTGWRMRSTGDGRYAVPFTSAQQRASRIQGWRLALLVSIDEGALTAAIDPAPAMQAFELRVARSSDTRVTVHVSGAPKTVDLMAARGAAISLELLYDPRCGCARLRDRGRVLIGDIPGVTGTPGRWGFSFGVAGSASQTADATFHTAMLEIRH